MSEHPTRFRYPQKVQPGRYECDCRVGGERLIVRFKTERDAMRFFGAVERGYQCFDAHGHELEE